MAVEIVDKIKSRRKTTRFRYLSDTNRVPDDSDGKPTDKP